MVQIDISRYKHKNNRQSPSPKKEGADILALLNKDISFGSGQISDRRKQEFYLELSMLLLSGVDLKTAFELVLVDQKKGKNLRVFEAVRTDVLRGDSLSQALKGQTGKFSDYEFYSVQIGEETGQLGEVLKELAQYYKNKISQRRKIISAITYPLIVLCTSLGAVFFMLKYVVPMFADVFTRFGGELPAVTAFILQMSHLLDRSLGWVVLGGGAVILLLYMNRKKAWYRKWSSRIVLQIPIAGDIVRKVHVARFANTMRLLVSTNTPLLQAIQLVRQMSDFYPIEQSLLRTEELILQGESLHASLARFDFYPSKLVQLVKVGEEVNRLDFFFDRIATQLTEEIEYKTSTISTVLEPLIIIFLGLVVGLILISMYLPMFQMSSGF